MKELAIFIDNNLNVDIKYTLIFVNIDTKEEVIEEDGQAPDLK